MREKKLVKRLLFLGILAGLCACEAAIVGMYFHPAFCPRIFLNGLRRLYMRERSIVQFDRECVRYDEALGYTLKPGTCRFKNAEFDTEIKVNSMGLRDDEAALSKPDIIVLGDSIAMGWGVDGERTLARELGKRTGLRTLNAAISGYGTVRQMRLLERLDVSALRYLIVYYCANDYDEENESFSRRGELAIPPRAEFEARLAGYAADRRYFPGKFLLHLLVKELRPAYAGGGDSAPVKASPVESFLNALRLGAPQVPPRTKLIVLTYDAAFAGELGKRSAAAREGDLIRRMKVVDLSRILYAGGSFILDEHPTADRHAAAAAAVSEAIGRF